MVENFVYGLSKLANIWAHFLSMNWLLAKCEYGTLFVLMISYGIGFGRLTYLLRSSLPSLTERREERFINKK